MSTDTRPLLTIGNSAKLYCLNWIERYGLAQDGRPVSILDLGCGSAHNFIHLLQTYPQFRYVGIEPSASDCALARKNLNGLNADIINGYGYDVYGRLVHEQFDIVVSFSALEHVYRRLDYIKAASACMKADGHFVINYDSGHFRAPSGYKDRLKTIIGPILARFGYDRYYQAFVREADFRAMVDAAGLRIVEAKSFNTRLKGVYKAIPAELREAYMHRWLEFEEWLNAASIDYDDSKANSWFTRNFILQRK